MKDFFFSEGKKKGWPAQGNYSIEQKGDANKEKDRGLLLWPSVQPRPKNAILSLRFQPLAEDKLSVCHSLQADVCQFSLQARMSSASRVPFVPRERSTSTRSKRGTAVRAMLFPSPIPPLRLECFQMKWLDFSQGKEHLTASALLNSGIHNNFSSVCHLPSVRELQCCHWFNHTVQFLFSL